MGTRRLVDLITQADQTIDLRVRAKAAKLKQAVDFAGKFGVRIEPNSDGRGVRVVIDNQVIDVSSMLHMRPSDLDALAGTAAQALGAGSKDGGETEHVPGS